MVYEFVKQAKECGVDVFRVFDSLNYVENLKVGIDAVLKAGGICEAAICYTGDVLNKKEKTFNLDYYVKLARELVDLGVHILAIKDMAGLLKPMAARALVAALRKNFPNVPIHVHTHDTAGTGVASMLECVNAGADIVDAAIDSMSGMTSQPSMGAIVNALRFSDTESELDPENLSHLNEYWRCVWCPDAGCVLAFPFVASYSHFPSLFLLVNRQTRLLYAPFETNLKSGSSDVYLHEMPGGQYTNLMFQSSCLGLADQWEEVTKAYQQANELLGNIPKVTPSSKVVGDLAQFMVANKLDAQAVRDNANKLSFPTSVVGYFLGELGIPPNGFPQPLADDIRKGKQPVSGRPGAGLPAVDFDEVISTLEKKRIKSKITILDALSYILYPEVYEEFLQGQALYGKNISSLPTRYFLRALEQDTELCIELAHGKVAYIELVAVSASSGGKREVFFTVNGNTQIVVVESEDEAAQVVKREKAKPGQLGSVGSPMAGQLVEIRVSEGQFVSEQDPLVVLSAMKMETIVGSPIQGRVKRVEVVMGDSVNQGDLLVEIEPVDGGEAEALSRLGSNPSIIQAVQSKQT